MEFWTLRAPLLGEKKTREVKETEEGKSVDINR